jgi:hypothetical protein
MRLTTPKGAEHPRALFSPEEVKALRARAANEAISARALAREKGCHPETINRILRGETYR